MNPPEQFSGQDKNEWGVRSSSESPSPKQSFLFFLELCFFGTCVRIEEPSSKQDIARMQQPN